MLLCMCIACAVADSDDSSVISIVRFVTAKHIAISNHDACMYLFIDICLLSRWCFIFCSCLYVCTSVF